MNRYERIKNMTFFEMLKFLDNITERCYSADCESCPIHNIDKRPHNACQPADIKKWLESEVKER